ncbi:MAG: protein translocase subunit SecF [Candidatus Shapirobacteria bacterium]
MIRFIKHSWLYFSFSGFLLIISTFSLLKWGLLPSVDFQGGNLWEIGFEKEVNKEDWIGFVKGKDDILEVNQTGSQTWLIKSRPAAKDLKSTWQKEIENEFGSFAELRFESLSASLGHGLLTKTLISIGLAILGILIYISFRFNDKAFGICAILAMLHDSLILLGSFSLLGRFFRIEVDSLFMTAFLTILAFSVHDTVVVFDGIREFGRVYPKAGFNQLASLAINQTLVRSINNSMTIIFVLLSLFLLGGESTRYFSLALLIGTVLGTYSSTFIAVPLLVVWNRFF